MDRGTSGQRREDLSALDMGPCDAFDHWLSILPGHGLCTSSPPCCKDISGV